MEPIQGLERLVQLLRRRSVQKTAGEGAQTSGAVAASPSRRLSKADLEQDLRVKIRQLRQSSASPQSIGRVVLESMLAWEFGVDLRNEPKFAALVQRVQRHVESEPALTLALERLIRQLAR